MRFFSLPALLYLIVVLLITYEGVYKYPRWKYKGSDAVLSWDVAGYYMYLSTFFIYKDPYKHSFTDSLLRKYQFANLKYDQATKAPNGNYVFKYSAGMAVLYAPWFFIAHGVAKWFGYSTDGFSFPYQLFISLGCILYSFIGLYFLRKVLLNYFTETITAITVFIIAGCSNFLTYASTEAPNTHVPVFMLYCLLLHCTIKWYKKPSIAYSIGIGLCVGMSTLVRPIDVLSAFIPLGWMLIPTVSDIRSRFILLLRNRKYLLVSIIFVLAIGSIQLVYWKIFSGSWLYYSYGDEKFNFLQPNFFNCLLSCRKGWWVYSPVMLLVVPGFYALCRFNKQLFWTSLLFFSAYAYVVFSWQTWWYGGGFGQRALIQTYPILAFPISAIVALLLQRNIFWKFLIASFIAFCCWLNLVMMYQSHDNFPWEPENMSRKYYWKIFGKTSIEKSAILFVDHDEEYNGNPSALVLIDSLKLKLPDAVFSDSVIYYTPPYSIVCSHREDFVPNFAYNNQSHSLSSFSWIVFDANFYSTCVAQSPWEMAVLLITFHKDGVPVKTKIIRPQRLRTSHEWYHVRFDVQAPSSAYDKLIVTYMNGTGQCKLLMDDAVLYGVK